MAVEALAHAEATALEVAVPLAPLAGSPLDAQQAEGEVGVGRRVALGGLEEIAHPLGERRQVELVGERCQLGALVFARAGPALLPTP